MSQETETVKIIKAHKIRLNPTFDQERYFWKAANVARFAFNWGLAEYNRQKEAGERVRVIGKGDTLKSRFVAVKVEQFPWVTEVTSWAYQGAFADLQSAISRYFKLKKEGQLKPPPGWKPRKDGKPFGWPRFKAKDRATPSFYQANQAIKFDDHTVGLPIIGPVNMAEPLRFDGKVMGARVSYHANHWWLSVQVETEHEIPEHNNDAVGVDLGIKYLAVTSDGQIFDNPKPFEAAQRKLARLQRSFDRMEKGSKNRHEMKAKIARLHFRVANLRSEASHQMTTSLTRDYGIIGVEDLNVKGMMQNRRMSKALSDAAFYEKRRQLEYKSQWNGGVVVPTGQWFASSKLCNGCGYLNVNLKLADRVWPCPNCGRINHRDGNAAENIRDEALRILEETGRTTQADSINARGLPNGEVEAGK